MWKAFSAIFVTVFLAEIGDKWVVLTASSAAPGVVVGAQLERFIKPQTLKPIAGIGFPGHRDVDDGLALIRSAVIQSRADGEGSASTMLRVQLTIGSPAPISATSQILRFPRRHPRRSG